MCVGKYSCQHVCMFVGYVCKSVSPRPSVYTRLHSPQGNWVGGTERKDAEECCLYQPVCMFICLPVVLSDLVWLIWLSVLAPKHAHSHGGKHNGNGVLSHSPGQPQR
jgi:hypothetical protein